MHHRHQCITATSASPPPVHHRHQCITATSASPPGVITAWSHHRTARSHHRLQCVTTCVILSPAGHNHHQCISTFSASPPALHHHPQCITAGSASPPPMHHHSHASSIHLPSSYLVSSSQIVLENIALVRCFSHFFIVSVSVSVCVGVRVTVSDKLCRQWIVGVMSFQNMYGYRGL